MSRDNVNNQQILSRVNALGTTVQIIVRELQNVAENVTSLTRVVDRMDQRLVGVEKRLIKVEGYTALIPGIAEAVSSNSGDLDNHEKRLKELEKAAA